MNYIIIASIILVLMALKLTKFIAIAIVVSLVVMLILKNVRPKNR